MERKEFSAQAKVQVAAVADGLRVLMHRIDIQLCLCDSGLGVLLVASR